MSNQDLAYAFPYPEEEQSTFSCRGMTLRDYFAAAALQGLCANQSFDDEPYGRAARISYEQADAMLEARRQ